jgi:hypothetical protein
MLQSFGWNLSDAMDLTSISDSFLDTSSGGTNEISAENKTRQIWNRILTTLPLIYKTKGTEECIRLVLSCHGIPTTLIGIREYGGVDYSNTDKTSYTIDEKLFMLTFSGYRDYLSVPYDTSTKTVEFKVAFDSNRTWEPYTTIPLAVKYNQNDQVDWSVSAVKSPTKHTGKIYFTISGSQMSSSALPIFNGDIFNIMIRRNLPDDLFEYNSTPDIVPTKYDLWVQRADDGRTIYSSSVDSIYQKNENISFSNSGTLFFGNYSESSSFFGILDKILIWDSPIADNTFDDHCNNLSSYSYTGSSVSHETLKYRMHVEYPADLSTTNPSVIPNANEYYSSSIFINAHNFGLVTYSASFENCAYVSHSVYPYQFREVPYEQTFTITSYGPNKFKNQKVQRVSLETAARFDPNERSTYSTNKFVSPDSNRIGLFADPNSNKNTDIFRYLGDYGVSSLIASPEQLYEDRYYPLKNVRELYNRSGNKRVLYNEILTLYKFYFDKSIFDTIKQLIPARNITLTGVLIEPTVLERPKYQHKRIVSETSDLEYTSSAVTIVTSSNQTRPQTLSLTKTISVGSTPTGEFLFVDFNTDSSLFSTALYEHRPFYLPPGPYSNDDVVYKDFLQKQSRLTYVDEGWVKKFPIYGELGSVESHPDWPTLGSSPGFYETGSGYLFLKQCYFYVNVNQSIVNIRNGVQLNQKAAIDLSYISEPTVVYPKNISYVTIYDIENPEELGVQCDGAGKVIESTFSGSTARYLIKLWSARDSYSTDGEYEKSPVATSHSVFLYNTQFWNDSLYTTLVYTSPTTIFKAGDVFTSSFIDGYSPNYNIVLNGDNSGYAFYHDIGTFKVGPNSRTNNAYQSSSKLDPYATNLPYTFVVVNSTEKQYFETTAFYSRNHLKNKRIQFTKTSMPAFKNTTIDRYISSRQSIDTTVDVAGLEDNTLPVQSINVSNLNATNSDNVLIK